MKFFDQYKRCTPTVGSNRLLALFVVNAKSRSV